MKIVAVISNVVDGEVTSTLTREISLLEKKSAQVSWRKTENKVPVKRWFKVVGHKFVMSCQTILAITPQAITKEGVSFTISSDIEIAPFGNFTMVKNNKKGDVYILSKGESLVFRTSLENNYEEIILSIKE